MFSDGASARAFDVCFDGLFGGLMFERIIGMFGHRNIIGTYDSMLRFISSNNSSTLNSLIKHRIQLNIEMSSKHMIACHITKRFVS